MLVTGQKKYLAEREQSFVVYLNAQDLGTVVVAASSGFIYHVAIIKCKTLFLKDTVSSATWTTMVLFWVSPYSPHSLHLWSCILQRHICLSALLTRIFASACMKEVSGYSSVPHLLWGTLSTFTSTYTEPFKLLGACRLCLITPRPVLPQEGPGSLSEGVWGGERSSAGEGGPGPAGGGAVREVCPTRGRPGTHTHQRARPGHREAHQVSVSEAAGPCCTEEWARAVTVELDIQCFFTFLFQVFHFFITSRLNNWIGHCIHTALIFI